MGARIANKVRNSAGAEYLTLLAIFMSVSLARAKEILIDEHHTDRELGQILDACEEIADIFLDQLINKNYDKNS